MCLIVFAWRPEHQTPLLVAANRDEFYQRPSLPLAPWPTHPQLFAGTDLEAGGTWMGYHTDGRFAALTNIRDLSRPQGSRSRGHLVADFLQGKQSPEAYLAEVKQQLPDYSGFNLIVADRQQLWFLNAAEGQPKPLSSGIYAVSNASLDSPWPKLKRAKSAFTQALNMDSDEAFFNLLADNQPAADAELPNTGVGLEMERLLSSVFIASPNYGTRASSVLRVSATGDWQFTERRFGPLGQALGQSQFAS